ncbi:SRPBCC family protein [Pedobacter immunditicola]|uniref:SRPBCC family protein n=1 Tax=Pedobacter immunditicola TaxID=3133440 RepID=UPI0030AC3AA0
MKILKGLLFLLVGIVVLALVVALFVKKEYAIEREIVIEKPRQTVYDYIKFLKNQDQFSVWANMDPAMKKEYRGTDGAVGFVSAWESKNSNVGKGEQEIRKLQNGFRIDTELRFVKPLESTSYSYMTTEDYQDIYTKVKWNFTGKMNYPLNLMILVMNMDQTIGNQLQAGLDNLKVILENKEQGALPY